MLDIESWISNAVVIPLKLDNTSHRESTRGQEPKDANRAPIAEAAPASCAAGRLQFPSQNPRARPRRHLARQILGVGEEPKNLPRRDSFLDREIPCAKGRGSLVGVAVVVAALRRPNRRGSFLHWVEMYHPIKNHWTEFSARSVARFFCGNGAAQAKLGTRSQHSLSPFVVIHAGRGCAEIYMLVPLRDAQRNALIEVVFRQTLGCRVHHANQLVAVAFFFVQQ